MNGFGLRTSRPAWRRSPEAATAARYGVEIRSRNDKDLTHQYPAVAAEAGLLHATTAIMDGELVAVDASGHPPSRRYSTVNCIPATKSCSTRSICST